MPEQQMTDLRMLDNVATLSGRLAKLGNLRPVSFNVHSTGAPQTGFVAQEMISVYPECVVNQGDDGTLAVPMRRTTLWETITSKLIPDIVAAIQELLSKANAAQASADTANSKNSEQDSRLNAIEAKDAAQDATLLQLKTKLALIGIVINL